MKNLSMLALALLCSLPQSVSAQTVTALTLFDADSDTPLQTLVDGDDLNVAELPAISIAAETTGVVGSVRFAVNGTNVQTENVSPYAIAGDTSGDFNAWDPPLGTVTISATPFSGSNASGTPGSALSITVTIRDDAPPPNQAPVVDAGADLVLSEDTTSFSLRGTATDPDGDAIVAFAWSQLGGPSATLIGDDTAELTVNNAQPGLFLFALDVEDARGAVGRDTVSVRIGDPPPAGTLTGELRQWHKVTLTLDGPSADEQDTRNPFLDYRLDVTFTRDGRSYTVPGYFAADGNAGESGATQGNQWRVHFAPDATGDWTYTISFLTGEDVALDAANATGTYTDLHGLGGDFAVAGTDKTGRDHRSMGRLLYDGGRYLRFAGSGAAYIKIGADSPENFLGYADFDNTYDTGGSNNDLVDGVHHYLPHVQDWQPGDPTWHGDKGKGIIGALNYLSSVGGNSVYFLTMNVQGDGREVWPWTSPSERYRFDCSKLDQWEVVFEHMDRMGIMLHILTQETENDQLLDGGALGPERRLYYRELIARFSHHLGITWNLGEENTNTNSQRQQFASYFKQNDPYQSFVCVHTYPGQKEAIYAPLLGFADLDGPSLQGANNSVVREWIDRSAAAGKQWVVMYDEQGPANIGVAEDGPSNNHTSIRRDVLWGTLMAGGGGVEYYFGYSRPHNDLDCEDWRSRAAMWDFSRYAWAFFTTHLPFDQMDHANDLTSAGGDYVLAAPGDTYAVFLPNGGTADLQLESGNYSVAWFDPRTDGTLRSGTVTNVTGPGVQNLGLPPDDIANDWAILVQRTDLDSDGDAIVDGLDNCPDNFNPLQSDADADGIGDVCDADLLPGDLNGDCHVNLEDLTILLTRFGQSGTRTDGDFDDDGQIGASDLALLLSQFGEVCD